MADMNNRDVLKTVIQQMASAFVERVNSLIQVPVTTYGNITMPPTSPIERQANSEASSSGAPTVGNNDPWLNTNISSPCSSNRPNQSRTFSQAILEETLADDSEDEFQSVHSIPTYCGKRRNFGAPRSQNKRLCKRACKTFVRTIICIPHERAQFVASASFDSNVVVTIPRGTQRTELFALNLCAKLEIAVSSSEEKVIKEISTLFMNNFIAIENSSTLQFDFLKTIPGLKILQKAKVNSTFRWDGLALQSLSRTYIYIVTHPKHVLKFDQCVNPDLNRSNNECTSVVGSTCNNNQASAELTVDHPSSANNLHTGTSNEFDQQHSSLYSEYVTWWDSDDEDVALQEVLMQSAENFSATRTEDERTVEEVLLLLKEQIDEDSVTLFNVNRRKLLDGAHRALKRKNFNPAARISVKFGDDLGTSEGAIDAGRPTREFFRLVVAEVMNSSIFGGGEATKYITKCERAKENDHYFLNGRIIALSLIHGGPGPCCFSKLLYNQMLDLPKEYDVGLLKPSKMYDQLKTKFEKSASMDVCILAILGLFAGRAPGEPIDDAASQNEFLAANEKASALLQTAGLENLPFDKKKSLVTKCTRFCLEDRISQELERFTEGLNCLGFLEEMKKCPNGFAKLFLYHGDCLTAALLLDEIFINIERSERGSNSWIAENETLVFWRDYVCDAEDGSAECQLKNILVFATGADCVPPLGFQPTPSIKFSQETVFPTANTCCNILTLPLIPLSRNSSWTYETFKEKMDFGILNSPGFGVA